MTGLSDSQWASSKSQSPSKTSSKPTSSGRPVTASLSEEFDRFCRLLERLEWKLPALADGYTKAMAASSSEAEVMFKLDFFEYYSLLERALYHLLLVYRIRVSRDNDWHAHSSRSSSDRPLGLTASKYANTSNARVHDPRGAVSSAAVIDSAVNLKARYAPSASHRFHANLIDTFESPSNPLHGALGNVEVIGSLRSAKNLRNWWKEPDEEPCEKKRSLKEYDLDKILSVIVRGLMDAKRMAKETVANAQRSGNDAVDVDVDVDMAELGLQEAGWETVPDAMDWE